MLSEGNLSTLRFDEGMVALLNGHSCGRHKQDNGSHGQAKNACRNQVQNCIKTTSIIPIACAKEPSQKSHSLL